MVRLSWFLFESSSGPHRIPRHGYSLVQDAKKSGDPITIAIPIPVGYHALWYRYFLASAGIHPDKDVKLITLPPEAL